jgi:hypothetical protein
MFLDCRDQLGIESRANYFLLGKILYNKTQKKYYLAYLQAIK